MRTLIAVMSCQRDRLLGIHEGIRRRWAKNSPYDVRFFIGGGQTTLAADEVWVNAADGYADLSAKVKAILQWGLDGGYDYIVKADTDTEVRLDELYKYTSGVLDYIGPFGSPVGGTHHQPVDGLVEGAFFNYVSSNYVLSRKAAKIVVQFPPGGWAEDLWVGQILMARVTSDNIRAHDTESLFLHRGVNNRKCRICLKPLGENLTFCVDHEKEAGSKR